MHEIGLLSKELIFSKSKTIHEATLEIAVDKHSQFGGVFCLCTVPALRGVIAYNET